MHVCVYVFRIESHQTTWYNPAMDQDMRRLGSLTLVKKFIKKKEKLEIKSMLHCLKIDLG